eukprot:366474-Chlamydomonas_euryale.AAC.17
MARSMQLRRPGGGHRCRLGTDVGCILAFFGSSTCASLERRNATSSHVKSIVLACLMHRFQLEDAYNLYITRIYNKNPGPKSSLGRASSTPMFHTEVEMGGHAAASHTCRVVRAPRPHHRDRHGHGDHAATARSALL